MLFNVFLTILAQCLLVSAAPVSIQAEPWQTGTGGGIIGLVVLILDIIAWIEIFKSNRSVTEKVIWALVVFLFPIVGMVIYYLFSNRKSHNSGGYEPISS